jgi:hypothetical protein
MNNKPNTIQSTLLVSTLMVLSGSLNAASGADARPGAFYAALTNASFLVNTGSTVLVDAIGMVDEHKVDSAAGNQATQPYKRVSVTISASIHFCLSDAPTVWCRCPRGNGCSPR